MSSRHDFDPEHLQQLYGSLPVPVGSGQQVRAAVQRRRRRNAGILVAAGAVCGALSFGALSLAGSSSPPVANGVRIQQPQASERFPSDSVGDWLDHADAVLLVDVSGEQAGNSLPVDDGTGDVIVERSVTVQVQHVLWKSAGLQVPEELNVAAAGWIEVGSPQQLEIATAGVPRLEPEHQYLVAFRATECDAAGDQSGWSPIGSGAIWPADGERVGYGESEGRNVQGDLSQTAPESFERAMLGASLREVEDAIATASSGRPVPQDSSTCADLDN